MTNLSQRHNDPLPGTPHLAINPIIIIIIHSSNSSHLISMGGAQVPPTSTPGMQPQTPQPASSSQRVRPWLSAGQSPMDPIDLTGPDSPPRYSNPRKRNAETALNYSSPVAQQRPAKMRKQEGSKEKRLAMLRNRPSQEFQKVYERALSQRFYVLSRQRHGTEHCPTEEVEMTGSTGNVYTVTVSELPNCTCPHSMKGHMCKHIIYVSTILAIDPKVYIRTQSHIPQVLSRVLNAPFELVYQAALVPSELRRIFANAPPPPIPSEDDAGKRKPIEGDCSICFCEFAPAEDIVWCRAACGQNIHAQCFTMWARAKAGTDVTCPFCRSPWQADGDVSKVSKEKGVMDEGYVNVADQLGMTRRLELFSGSVLSSTSATWRNICKASWNCMLTA